MKHSLYRPAPIRAVYSKRETEHPMPTPAAFAIEMILKLLAAIALSALFAYMGSIALERQAEADYQECLAWKHDGHPVNCTRN
ncbi:hypothetical protein SAMN02745664_12414 [Moraxella cuniculi DSM 21768]|uniref:Uncharacterized protein n=1 Tax=Moraxella cuniculi DSM 21768 TaxID=1122245 RepID=A0A1N7G6H2_9GAMM|nr:hypothetical protein [Moraxella cuniculi]OOS04355.1 hypothetical protein B0189_08570 [Moraxella cuniculi]SIS08200.1 hypothetical protein SAMN02745664_12414 [Moraxella cuniculi DSM 21768]